MYKSNLRRLRDGKSFTRHRCYSVNNNSKFNNPRLNDFPETYQPNDCRKGWYEVWEKNQYFRQNKDASKTFRMILPPPNITGSLHLGHALTTTVQDILARWHRMKGASVVWIPGLDHAGIATQAVVEKYLYKTKNIKRSDMKKSDFIDTINKWKNEKSQIIEDQLKTLGASLDWSREYFTMSKHHNRAVQEAFVTLDKRNLLYRQKSLVNWSSALGSTLSDIEVDNMILTGKTDIEIPGYKRKVTFGQIFEVGYDLEDGSEQLKVATTRPETIHGDVALAVHPNDSRYSQFIGRRVKHPLKDSYIPIIADENVIMDFGTGIVKITPAHDRFDYKVAVKNNLEMIDVIDENGQLTEQADEYAGLPRFIARTNIINQLQSIGKIKSIKDHPMQIPRCSRTGDIIELILKEQWFMKCKDMMAKAYKAVENGSLRLNPSFHNQLWFNWLDENNCRDWCISRQLVWGHQIPAYFCKKDGVTKWIVAHSEEEAKIKATELFGENFEIYQDNDVLDTWFSSALLPFSALGWPEKSADMKQYYPLSLMETGHDILFFWVARMVMLGLELTNQLPFEEVLLHGVLCDANGRKMSKSSGNVILPENVINGISLEDLNDQAKASHNAGILSDSELKRTTGMNKKLFPNGIPECGVDALRLTLCSHNIKKPTISFDVLECQQNKFFCNKIFQASKYALLMTDDSPIVVPEKFTVIDEWILSRLAWMVETVNDAFDHRDFHKAMDAIKQFLYYEYCDYFIEGTKRGFMSEDKSIVNSHRYALTKCLEVSIKILAPIAPYFCDDLYSRLSKKLSIFTIQSSLCESAYPDTKDLLSFRDVNLETKMERLIQIVLSLRSLLGSISDKSDLEGHIVVNNTEDLKLLESSKNIIVAVSKLSNIQIIGADDYKKCSNCISGSVDETAAVHVIINNETVLKNTKDLLERRRVKAEEKLQKLIKKTSSKKYSSNESEEQKKADQSTISTLQGELKKIPLSS
ncbi:hypothetical protein TKK_0009203 [Trichogramma kaykai]